MKGTAGSLRRALLGNDLIKKRTSPNGSGMRLWRVFDSPLPVPLSGKPFAAMGLEGGFSCAKSTHRPRLGRYGRVKAKPCGRASAALTQPPLRGSTHLSHAEYMPIQPFVYQPFRWFLKENWVKKPVNAWLIVMVKIKKQNNQFLSWL